MVRESEWWGGLPEEVGWCADDGEEEELEHGDPVDCEGRLF